VWRRADASRPMRAAGRRWKWSLRTDGGAGGAAEVCRSEEREEGRVGRCSRAEDGLCGGGRVCPARARWCVPGARRGEEGKVDARGGAALEGDGTREVCRVRVRMRVRLGWVQAGKGEQLAWRPRPAYGGWSWREAPSGDDGSSPAPRALVPVHGAGQLPLGAWRWVRRRGARVVHFSLSLSRLRDRGLGLPVRCAPALSIFAAPHGEGRKEGIGVAVGRGWGETASCEDRGSSSTEPTGRSSNHDHV
jgi:hypothetical protein